MKNSIKRKLYFSKYFDGVDSKLSIEMIDCKSQFVATFLEPENKVVKLNIFGDI